jgi:hypothetical protein
MQSRFSKLVIMVFLLSVLPSNFQVANSNEILWGPNFGNDAYRPSNLVPGAEIRSVRPLVYKSNPDEMIFKITMVDSFEDKPFTNKGRYLALNIFVGNANCVNTNITTDDERCKSVQSVIAPDSPRLYPTSKSDEWVPVYDREVTFGPKRVATSCKAPWWIESNFKSRDTWAFAISITCLKLPKEFGFYGVSDIDLGQKEVAYTTSITVTTEYPFHELAKAAADRASQNPSRVGNMVEICETFTRGANSSDWEPYVECDTKGSYELSNCSLHPRADLQTYKNGEWIKIKTMRGKKTGCFDNRYLFEHVVNFKTPFEREYRWKEYGKSKLKTSYYYLKISQKLIAE